MLQQPLGFYWPKLMYLACMPKETHSYTNGEITVIWRPAQCVHSRVCWSQLKEVFNPTIRPWIDMQGASTERIAEQVRRCPSGALSIKEVTIEEPEPEPTPPTPAMPTPVLEVTHGGPLLVKGPCLLKLPDGSEMMRQGTTALCRCGHSQNKPFCDGSHRTAPW